MITDRQVKNWDWTIVILCIIIPLFSFNYMDTESITRCGIDVFRSIFAGRFDDFYAFAKESQLAGLMGHEPTYDIVFYFTIGIWEFPIAVIETLMHVSFKHNTIVMIYSKTLLLVFVFACSEMIQKIAIELGISQKNAKWAKYMFLTSGFIYAYTCIAGQYDIIGIFFSLAGVYYYLKEDMKKFGVLFIVAVQYKFFPLFIFIPLLLLKEKNVKKIILYLIGPVISVLLFRIPFMDDGIAIIEKNAINADMLDRIFRNRISIFETEIPLSFLFVGAVCIWCYLKEIEENERKYYAIWVPFLSLGLLFMSFPFFPYWILYLAPWIPLLYYMRSDMTEKFFWLETGMTVSILLAQFSHFYWVFEIDNTKNLLLDLIYRFEKIDNPFMVMDIMGDLYIDDYEFLFYGLFILCLAFLLVLLKPKSGVIYKDDEFNSRRVLYLRFGIQYVIGALPLFLYICSIFRNFVTIGL
ncbi:MAG: hypothetical protein K2N95_09105 [Lachnospiraceae bacterium]|nr:hypothetical protein [Lachnospiraceae bacterium]